LTLYIHPADRSGHKQADFICEICNTQSTKNYRKSSFKAQCRKCMLGVCKFLTKANNVHDSAYKYKLKTYVHSRELMTIICPTHGNFKQRPSDHIAGQGCPVCARQDSSTNNTKTHLEFLTQCKRLHANRDLSFECTTYTGPTNNVEVSCGAHGVFKVTIKKLLKNSNPCPQCSVNYIGTRKYIERATSIHGDTYDYSNTVYVRARTKVNIICRIHGKFQQGTARHLDGSGCSKCAKHGYNPSKPGYLYYLYLPSILAYKIGVTNTSIENRYLRYEQEFFNPVFIKYFSDGSQALKIEQWLISRYVGCIFKGVNPLNSGHTELFSTNILKAFTQHSLKL